MTELDEIPLDSEIQPPGGGQRSGSPLKVLVAVAVVLAVGAGAYFVIERFRAPEPPPAATAPAAREAPAPVAEPAPQPIELPPLDASDALVRELARALSANPELAAWLTSEGLIRRATVVVDNVAEGVTPAKHLPFLAPQAPFAVESGTAAGDVAVIDAASYRRYDRVGAVVASFDAQGLAQLYRRLEPLFDQAYRDLGYPDRRFRDTLTTAIRSLLATPVPPARVEVVGGPGDYRFRDRRLEGLTAAQKQLLRTGPENVRRIQAKLREFAAALGLQV